MNSANHYIDGLNRTCKNQGSLQYTKPKISYKCNNIFNEGQLKVPPSIQWSGTKSYDIDKAKYSRNVKKPKQTVNNTSSKNTRCPPITNKLMHEKFFKNLIWPYFQNNTIIWSRWILTSFSIIYFTAPFYFSLFWS